MILHHAISAVLRRLLRFRKYFAVLRRLLRFRKYFAFLIVHQRGRLLAKRFGDGVFLRFRRFLR